MKAEISYTDQHGNHSVQPTHIMYLTTQNAPRGIDLLSYKDFASNFTFPEKFRYEPDKTSEEQ